MDRQDGWIDRYSGLMIDVMDGWMDRYDGLIDMMDGITDSVGALTLQGVYLDKRRSDTLPSRAVA